MDNTLAKDVIYFKCCRAIALSTIRSNRHFLIMAPTAPVWCWFAFYSSYGYDLKANRWVLWYAAMVSMLTIAHTFSHHSLSNRKFAKLTMSLLVFRDNLKCMVIIRSVNSTSGNNNTDNEDWRQGLKGSSAADSAAYCQGQMREQETRLELDFFILV
jgi:hypothetical protein